MMWTMQDAVILVPEVERELARIGAHVALGGGVMMAGNSDNDLDLFIYPHKTSHIPLEAAIWKALEAVGIRKLEERPHQDHGDDKPVFRCEYQEKRVDVFLLSGHVRNSFGLDGLMEGQWEVANVPVVNAQTTVGIDWAQAQTTNDQFTGGVLVDNLARIDGLTNLRNEVENARQEMIRNLMPQPSGENTARIVQPGNPQQAEPPF